MRVFTEDAAYSERFPVTSKLKRLYREEAPEMIYTEWDKYRDELIKVYEEKGRAELLAELVTDGLLSEEEAAKRLQQHAAENKTE